MAVIKQSTAYTRLFKMISSTDHLSLKTAASPVVNLSKAGAAFGAAGGTITEIANGWYKIALTTTDTNTLGDLAFYITGTGADDTDFADQVCANILGDTLPASLSGTQTFNMTGNITGTLSTCTTVTNQLTAAQIATGVWTDTTAGDFTTALSVGKSLMNGVSLGTGLTIASVSGSVGSVSGSVGSISGVTFPTNFSSLGISAGGHISNVDTLTTYTGNTVQTGDSYARLGAPAGASVSADVAAVKTDTGNIVTTTNKFAFTVANKVDSNVLAINGSSTGAVNLSDTTQAIGRATVGSASSTTSIVCSACSPGATASGQFIGRTILFDANTTTASLQGQATAITANTNGGGTPTFTVTALTTAPVSGDTFSIV